MTTQMVVDLAARRKAKAEQPPTLTEELALSLVIDADGGLQCGRWFNCGDEALSAPELRRRAALLQTLARWCIGQASDLDPSGDDECAQVAVFKDGRVRTFVYDSIETDEQREWLRKGLEYGLEQACQARKL